MKQLTTEQKTAFGGEWASILMLKKSKDHKGRYLTTWGDKTPLGIYETINRLTIDQFKDIN